ncbi:hypothetical protein ACHAXA_008366 [Cyclostephanos tholiformis]|uniref:Cobalamin adenosyltransferase-like domain-containing protein n=1 Tax=Cyclostephanos tholiformis TaxID=382380 RepID=A0ABD3RW20_9STRA
MTNADAGIIVASAASNKSIDDVPPPHLRARARLRRGENGGTYGWPKMGLAGRRRMHGWAERPPGDVIVSSSHYRDVLHIITSTRGSMTQCHDDNDDGLGIASSLVASSNTRVGHRALFWRSATTSTPAHSEATANRRRGIPRQIDHGNDDIIRGNLPRTFFHRDASSDYHDVPPRPRTSPPPTTRRDGDDGPAVAIVDIEDIHRNAILDKRTTYIDPRTDFTVFTELAHLRRGTCCGNKCRHCPYGWSNVKGGGGMDDKSSSAKNEVRAVSGDRAMTAMLVKRILDGTYYEVVDDVSHRSEIAHRRGSIELGGGAAKSRGIDDKSQTYAKSMVDNTQVGRGRNERNATVRGEGKSAALGKLTSKNVPYTRVGDSGTSQLFTGERRSKDDVLFEALGTVDELCSIVGVVYAELNNTSRAEQQRRRRRPSYDDVDEVTKKISPSTSPYGDLPEQLLDVMSRLFDVGSHIACPPASPLIRRNNGAPSIKGASNGGGGFDPQHTTALEGWIDSMTEELPELLSFVIPTGSVASAQLHVARTVCRRAERRMVPLVHGDDGNVDPAALAYVNRLSDYLFTAARYVNYCDGNDEVQYKVETMRVPDDANGEDADSGGLGGGTVAIVSPRESPWQKLYKYADATSFLHMTGLTRECFHLLLADLFDLQVIARLRGHRSGRPRSLGHEGYLVVSSVRCFGSSFAGYQIILSHGEKLATTKYVLTKVFPVVGMHMALWLVPSVDGQQDVFIVTFGITYFESATRIRHFGRRVSGGCVVCRELSPAGKSGFQATTISGG